MTAPISIADRMDHVEPFHVMDVLARAKALEAAGRSIIHMEVGEPDFTTAQPIIEAGKQALDQGKTGYTPATGIPELKQAISHFYAQRFDVSVEPERIIITPGASGALQLALNVLVNANESVIMADPGYPCNRHFVSLVGAEPINVACDASTEFQLNKDLVNKHWQAHTTAMMLASPSNPTGTVLKTQVMKSLIEWCHEHQAHCLVDEIYQGLIYGQSSSIALAISQQLFVINSFSKYFGMTGWRLGWLIAPQEYVPSFDRLSQNLFLSPPTVAQYAALAAFSPEAIAIHESRRAEFAARRQFLMPALRDIGFDIPCEPQGAFYIYADCSAFSDDSYQLALDMLEQTGVAVTPGKDFGYFQNRRYLRIAYTQSIPKLEEAVERMSGFLTKG